MCLVSIRLGRFTESSGVFEPLSCLSEMSGYCDALLCVFHTLQSAFETGKEARIVQIDFSAAFERVTHQVIRYKLCSVDIIGSVLLILTQFL